MKKMYDAGNNCALLIGETVEVKAWFNSILRAIERRETRLNYPWCNRPQFNMDRMTYAIFWD